MLSGKLALVTGGGSGIGRAVSKLMAREGAKVVVSDFDLAAAETTVSLLQSGSEHSAVQLDVSSTTQVSQVIETVISRYAAPPTVLVNSAGITRDAFLLKMTPDQFTQVLDVNIKVLEDAEVRLGEALWVARHAEDTGVGRRLAPALSVSNKQHKCYDHVGTFAVTQAICQALVTAKISGSIVNIASVIGQIGNMGQSNYAASKAAVEAFTKTVAKEMGLHKVRCNAVVPGFILTPMTDKVPDKVKSMFTSQIPLARLGTPEEVAEVIVFLASDRSSYVNGASVNVTGGL